MRYKDVPCTQCGNVFVPEDDIVVCPVCGSPHHRACWQEHGACANDALHAQGFAWVSPAVKAEEKKEIKQAAAPTDVKIVECPFCGAQNYDNELYCTVCHEPIHQNASADAGEPLQDEQQREKMYADFQTYGGLNPQSTIGEISVHEYSAYLGNKAGPYIRRFLNIHQTGRPISWNWAAFWTAAVSMFSNVALGPVWFFYRKLNKSGALFLALMLLLGIVSGTVFAVDPAYWEWTERTRELYTESMMLSVEPNADVTQIISDFQLNLQAVQEQFIQNASDLTHGWSYFAELLYSFVIPICSALFASVLYFKKSRSEILGIRSQYGAQADYLQKLGKKGGVSAGGAVIGAVLCFAVYLVQQYFPFLLKAIGLV